MIAEELVAHAIEFVGGDSGANMPADFDECIGRDPPCVPHSLDDLWILDLGTFVGGRCALADILWAGDGRRNLS